MMTLKVAKVTSIPTSRRPSESERSRTQVSISVRIRASAKSRRRGGERVSERPTRKSFRRREWARRPVASSGTGFWDAGQDRVRLRGVAAEHPVEVPGLDVAGVAPEELTQACDEAAHGSESHTDGKVGGCPHSTRPRCREPLFELFSSWAAPQRLRFWPAFLATLAASGSVEAELPARA